MKTKLGGALAAASLLASALITVVPNGSLVNAATGADPIVIVVDVTTDTPGTCSLVSATSQCSLRSAVALANAQRNVDVTVQLALSLIHI